MDADVTQMESGAELLDDLALGSGTVPRRVSRRSGFPSTLTSKMPPLPRTISLSMPNSLLDLSRQTGGSGEVVSNAAVVDSNVHGALLVFTRIAVTLSRPPRSLAVSISS